MKKRILIIAPDFYPNLTGYANAALGLVQGILNNTDLLVDVITLSTSQSTNELLHERLKIIRIQPYILYGKKQNFIFNELALYKRIKSLNSVNKYDYILFETAEFPITGILALSKFRDKIIVRVHATAETEWILYNKKLLYRLKRIPTKLFFKKVKFILSTNNYYLEFIKIYFLKNNPLLIASKYYGVVPNILPILTETSDSSPQIEELKEIQKKNLTFLTLGRMDYDGELQKNFSRLLLAISFLKEKPYFNNLKFFIIGNGDYQDRLKSLSFKLKIEENIIFINSLPNHLIHFLQKTCDGVILPSTFEGLSMFALEALANRGILFFSNCGGLKDLVDNQINGFLFNPFDPENISNILVNYLEDFKEKKEEFRENSFKKYNSQFNSKITIKKFVTFLNQFISLEMELGS